MGYAFISYSSTQQRQFGQLKTYLQANEIAFWSAPEDIPIGSKYSEVIKRAIANSSCVLFLLSERSQNSTYCKLEIALALKLEKPIIPIQLEDVILNADFSDYLSRSEFFPLPKKITTAKSNKLLYQLRLLCADPGQAPAEPPDPSYRVGRFKKGTWLQSAGWIWMVGGFVPFNKLAEICFLVPIQYPGAGGDGLDRRNAPVIAERFFSAGVLVSALLTIGLLTVLYGFSLNRKKFGATRLFFGQFSLCQVLLLASWGCFGISFPLFFQNTANHLDHYVSSFWVQHSNDLICLAFVLLLITLLTWLFLRIRQIFRCKKPLDSQPCHK